MGSFRVWKIFFTRLLASIIYQLVTLSLEKGKKNTVFIVGQKSISDVNMCHANE
jgi:hypothetical protein